MLIKFLFKVTVRFDIIHHVKDLLRLVAFTCVEGIINVFSHKEILGISGVKEISLYCLNFKSVAFVGTTVQDTVSASSATLIIQVVGIFKLHRLE